MLEVATLFVNLTTNRNVSDGLNLRLSSLNDADSMMITRFRGTTLIIPLNRRIRTEHSVRKDKRPTGVFVISPRLSPDWRTDCSYQGQISWSATGSDAELRQRLRGGSR